MFPWVYMSKRPTKDEYHKRLIEISKIILQVSKIYDDGKGPKGPKIFQPHNLQLYLKNQGKCRLHKQSLDRHLEELIKIKAISRGVLCRRKEFPLSVFQNIIDIEPTKKNSERMALSHWFNTMDPWTLIIITTTSKIPDKIPTNNIYYIVNWNWFDYYSYFDVGRGTSHFYRPGKGKKTVTFMKTDDGKDISTKIESPWEIDEVYFYPCQFLFNQGKITSIIPLETPIFNVPGECFKKIIIGLGGK